MERRPRVAPAWSRLKRRLMARPLERHVRPCPMRSSRRTLGRWQSADPREKSVRGRRGTGRHRGYAGPAGQGSPKRPVVHAGPDRTRRAPLQPLTAGGQLSHTAWSGEVRSLLLSLNTGTDGRSPGKGWEAAEQEPNVHRFLCQVPGPSCLRRLLSRGRFGRVNAVAWSSTPYEIAHMERRRR